MPVLGIESHEHETAFAIARDDERHGERDGDCDGERDDERP